MILQRKNREPSTELIVIVSSNSVEDIIALASAQRWRAALVNLSGERYGQHCWCGSERPDRKHWLYCANAFATLAEIDALLGEKENTK